MILRSFNSNNFYFFVDILMIFEWTTCIFSSEFKGQLIAMVIQFHKLYVHKFYHLWYKTTLKVHHTVERQIWPLSLFNQARRNKTIFGTKIKRLIWLDSCLTILKWLSKYFHRYILFYHISTLRKLKIVIIMKSAYYLVGNYTYIFYLFILSTYNESTCEK